MLGSYFIYISILCLLYWFSSYVRKQNKLKSLKELPGVKPTPWYTNLRWLINFSRKKLELEPSYYLLNFTLGYNSLFQKEGINIQWYFSNPLVSIFKGEYLEEILNNSKNIDKSFEYSFLHPWLGRGLLTSSGSKWKSRRKILTPAFHFQILEEFIPIFNEQSKILVNKIESMLEQDYVNISPLIMLCTLDIICESVMGVHIEAQKHSNSEYVEAIHNLGSSFLIRIIRPWLWPDLIFFRSTYGNIYKKSLEIVHGFTKQVMREKKEVKLKQKIQGNNSNENNLGKMHSKKRLAFMDLLLDLHINENVLSEEDIREEIDTFMFEGHDTTAIGITFALYFIGLYPDIQMKIVEEMNEVLGMDKDRFITMEDAKKLKYLECTLKESQRLHPSVPIIGRTLTSDVKLNNVTIPKGTAVHCNIISLHRNPDEFPNPEVFDPERFLPENTSMRHPYAYVPFSAGPRNCIGQKFAMLEEKIVISNILRHFEVKSLDPRDRIQVKFEFTLKPIQPIRLKFEKRIDFI